jgi:hypothetical protein
LFYGHIFSTCSILGYGIEDPIPFILKRHNDGVIALLSIKDSDKITDESIIISYIENSEGNFASKPMIEEDLVDQLTITKSSIKNKLQAMEDKDMIKRCELNEVPAQRRSGNSNVIWFTLVG